MAEVVDILAGMSDQRPRRESQGKEFSSWKEIAAYLGVSVRTAQYWEKKHGLPVRRLPGPRGTPVSVAAELDAWKWSEANRNNTPGSLPPAVEGDAERGGSRTYPALGVAILLTLAALLYGMTLESRGPEPKLARLVGDHLAAFDAEGHELWKKTFVPPLYAEQYGPGWPERGLVWTGDLNGDGRTEVVLGVIGKPIPVGYVICYGGDGRELWRFQPDFRVRTSTRMLTNAWMPGSVAVASAKPNGPMDIWVSFLSRDSSPSVVARLSNSGKLQSYYLHSGHLHVLRLWNRGPERKTVLLAAGINNRREMATVVVLDPDRLSGVSGEPGSREEQLLGQLSQSEIARLFFPRTRLNREIAEYNGVRDLRTSEEHLEVLTDEEQMGAKGSAAIVRYDLNLDFRVLGVRFHDVFEPVHHKYFRQGLLDRDFDSREIAELRDGYDVEAGSSAHRARVAIGNGARGRGSQPLVR